MSVAYDPRAGSALLVTRIESVRWCNGLVCMRLRSGEYAYERHLTPHIAAELHATLGRALAKTGSVHRLAPPARLSARLRDLFGR